MRYRSQEVKVGGVVYRLRAHLDVDGGVRIQVRGGGEAAGELVAPADHLAALGQAVVELARAFGGRAWTVEEARKEHKAAYARWTEEEDARLPPSSPQAAPWRKLAELFGRKPSAIVSRLRRLKLSD